MQAIPDIKTPNIHPPIALLNAPPKNNPTIPHKIIIITEIMVLKRFTFFYAYNYCISNSTQ